jgi:Fe-S-cluster containining protein
MNEDKNSQFEQYKVLRDEIDNYSKTLEKEHSEQMVCKVGCDKCCMDYSIFPIEFYSILNDLKSAGIHLETIDGQDENVCVFLKKHICAIYEQRPIICRTHGLPLLFMNDNSDWELSVCDLNFTEFDFGSFSLENTFPQDKYNSKLFLLNKKFISEFKEKQFSEFDLIPIKDLATQLF